MAATDAQTDALGFTRPQGTDPIRNGDNAITQNAKASAGLILDLQADVTAVQAATQDTGWRNVTATPWLPDTGIGVPSMYVRRIGNVVWVAIDAKPTGSPTSSTLAGAVPSGFRPGTSTATVKQVACPDWNVTTGSVSFAGVLAWHYNGTAYLRGGVAGSRMLVQESWTTGNSWPSTLPGTPA